MSESDRVMGECEDSAGGPVGSDILSRTESEGVRRSASCCRATAVGGEAEERGGGDVEVPEVGSYLRPKVSYRI